MATSDAPQNPTPRKPATPTRKSIMVHPTIHSKLEKSARKLGIKNSDYASAAINYFAENGLDPRVDSKSSLAKIENRVVQETYDVREHNANIGNRLVGVIRTFERNVGTLVQQQQAGTFKYLESIERNILGYLMNIEENLLTTILERVVMGNVESYINRIMLQVTSLQLDSKRFPFSETELTDLTKSYDQQRNEQIVVENRKLLESKKVPRPRSSVMPAVVEMPKAPVAVKPVNGTPPATAQTPPAASAIADTST